jgi:hypothetical protein
MVLSFDKLKNTLLQIADPVRRRVFFVGLLSAEMLQRGAPAPIIVGGEAVELYTQGGYTTGDIDLKADFDAMREILLSWGFEGAGPNKRIWISRELDIYIDWLGAVLDEGPDAADRTNLVSIDKGVEVRVLSFEDLIIDRLSALKFWNDSDSGLWARAVFDVAKSVKGPDMEYLKRRALERGVTKELDDLLYGDLLR